MRVFGSTVRACSFPLISRQYGKVAQLVEQKSKNRFLIKFFKVMNILIVILIIWLGPFIICAIVAKLLRILGFITVKDAKELIGSALIPLYNLGVVSFLILLFIVYTFDSFITFMSK